jgi:glycosidase
MMMNRRIIAVTITFSLLFALLHVPINVVEAAAQDNDVWWDGVYYDSRDSYYRSPIGFVYRIGNVTGDVVPPDENVTIRIRVYENDVTAVKLRVWKSYAASEQIFDMTKENADGTYEWWKVTIPAPNTVEDYWYFFQLIDGTDYDSYSDDSVRDGGVGQMYDANWLPGNDYLLAYRSPPPANDPQSMVIYQIVTDRFYDGDNSNNDPAESSGLYDPRRENGNWKYYWGGDLAGIENKIDYIKGMGVTGIWISPVVDSVNEVLWPENENETSYHGYFARDFKQIEEHFGTWESFDNLITASGKAGIRVIIDFAPNHANPTGTGENSALYDNGVFVTDNASDYANRYFNDITRSWENIFHHNGETSDRNDRWQTRYQNVWGVLPDLNQLNEWVDNYLKESINLYLERGIGGIRVDMSKHMDPGWLKTFADNVYAGWENIFITHEWFNGFYDELYWDLANFDNNSGMHALNIPLNWTIRDVFGYKTKSMLDLEARINQQFAYPVSDFEWNQKLVNFISSHDTPRFLSIMSAPDENSLNQALALTLTIPGIPNVYYGEEQYLHNDNINKDGVKGGDPYNREMMKHWDTTTTAYKTIRKLSDLRLWNPALRYGLITTRYVDADVYVYQRKFFNDVTLVAINKDNSNDRSLTNVSTDLPNGTYVDYLENLLGNGQSITVNGGNISSMTLPKGSVGVWYVISAADNAWLGAIDPVMGRPGTKVQINGKGFGENTGSVKFDDGSTITNATITSWSDERIIFQVPSGVSPATKHVDVYVVRADNVTTSNKIKFQYLTKRQVVVVHAVDNTKGTNLETTWGEHLFVTGSVPEYSMWSNRSENTLGPMLPPAWDNWFFVVSAPYSTYIEFKHVKATLGGAGTWEVGTNHSYTSPESGILYVRVEANT